MKVKLFEIKHLNYLRILLTGIILIFFLSLISPKLPITSYAKESNFTQSTIVPNSCTIFTVNYSSKVFFGNNEDNPLPGAYMWLVPSQEINTPNGRLTTYGGVGLGFNYNDAPGDGQVQGGMNDQGLCLDANGLPVVYLNPHPELDPIYIGGFAQVLMECRNVSEVIDWFQSHYLTSSWGCQVHVADASGDAVVVSVGPEGDFNFTRKSNSHYLVSTNFNLVNYANGYYPCSRYTTACNMLKDISSEENLTVHACRDVLDAVHQEWVDATTIYSNIFDPVNLNCYLFYNHNYLQNYTFNLEEELAKVHPGGSNIKWENGLYLKEIRISSLFIEDAIIPSYSLIVIFTILIYMSIVMIYRSNTRRIKKWF